MNNNNKEREVLERWNLIYNASPIAVNFWDKDLNFIDGNELGYKIFGYDSKEDWKENWQLSAPKVQPDGTPSMKKFNDGIEKAISDGFCHFEWLHYTKSGEPLPLDVTLSRVEYDDNYMVVAFLQDLRPLQEAAAKLQQEEEHWRHINDVNPVGVMFWDDVDTIPRMIDCNRSAHLMVGIEDKDYFINNLVTDVWPEYQPDGKKTVESAIEVAQKTLELGTYTHDWMLKTIDGEPVPTKSITALMEYRGKTMGASFFEDLRPTTAVNERVKEANKLNERMQVMLNSSPLACFILGENLSIIDLNEVTINLFKAENRQDFIDNFPRAVPELQADGTLSINRISEFVGKTPPGEIISFEWLSQTFQGEIFPCEVHGTTFILDDKKVAIVHVRDLRDFLKHEQEQKVLFTKLEAANKAKSRFLSNMSHEIRTPMSAIIGMTDIARNVDSSEKKDDCLVKIEKASKHLLGIINQILDISKIEAEQFILDSYKFRFERMIDEVINVVKVGAEEKGIELEVDLDNAIPQCIISDEVRIVQVLTNLLSNAIKFTPEGGTVTLTTKLIDGDEKVIRTEVADTGIGISGEQLPYLFGAFVQLETDAARKFGGTGLGLSISKGIVEMMGGRIWVESQEGKGSRFIFTIPVEVCDKVDEDLNSAVSSVQPQGSELDNDFKGHTILVAEDMEINREIVSALLESTGIEIEYAFDGTQAVWLFRDSPERYGLIFMDVQMPGMDGIVATRLIRELDCEKSKTIPIIAMTANVFKEDIDKCLKAGMNDHLGKPLDLEQVMAKLRLYLKRL